MRDILLSIGLVAVFILTGGVFAAAEMALVSLREGQVRALSEQGSRGRRVAELHKNPNLFLAAVQVGVTFTGFLSAAFGESTLAGKLRGVFERHGLTGAWADVLATLLITVIIAYFAIVVGELSPKRLALQRVEGYALALAPFLDRMARLLKPAVWLLGKSTNAVVRLLGGDPTQNRETITEEELRDLVAGHESLTPDERRLIDEVFAASNRQLREVMIPRTEVEFLDASMTVGKALRAVSESGFSRYPVFRSSYDDVIGFVHVRDLFNADVRPTQRLGDIARDVALLPSTLGVLPALSDMRRSHQHLAIVVDEYGGTAGIVTLEDLIEEVIGDIRDEYDEGVGPPRRLLTGESEVDGLLNLDDFADETGVALPDGPYETAAGYVMAMLKRLPVVGDRVAVPGAVLTVTDMDGRRIAKLRVMPDQPPDVDDHPGRSAAVARDVAEARDIESATRER
ncbi:MAG: magnesium and cobalt exporter, family [Frankiaceae bacterium]|jgi:putative hemolysin|nr:magnesium and cobalt exporter, family [Frankiaceae bacterium]